MMRQFTVINIFLRDTFFQPKPVDVQVITHHMQRYAVWFGGSMLASTVSTMCFVGNTFVSSAWSFRISVECNSSMVYLYG